MFRPVLHNFYCYSKEDIDYVNNLRYIKKIEIFCNKIKSHKIHRRRERFIVLDLVGEPEFLRTPNSVIIENSNLFDLIFAWDVDILNKCNNSVKMLLGTSWVLPCQIDNVINNKKFEISFLCGSKMKSDGHVLRRIIWDRQMDIKTKKSFFRSGQKDIVSIDNNPVLDPHPYAKYTLFNSKFHICIENTRCYNYFSEKIIDCFITKTIPIYNGCLNIGEYFDSRGFFIANTDDEIVDICNSLDNSTYERMIPYVNENYNRCKEYYPTVCRRIFNMINNISISWR